MIYNAKILINSYIQYINNKKICFTNEDAANLIVKLVDNHPYYAQQLAQQSWLRTCALKNKIWQSFIFNTTHYNSVNLYCTIL